MPLHSVPRLGSACPHSGIAPGARRHRPSMAGGGYRGIHAAVPPAQRLRLASRKGAGRARSKATATATATATASRASSLPQVIGWVEDLRRCTNHCGSKACPRRRWHIQHWRQLTPGLREQASLQQGRVRWKARPLAPLPRQRIYPQHPPHLPHASATNRHPPRSQGNNPKLSVMASGYLPEPDYASSKDLAAMQGPKACLHVSRNP